MRAAVAGVAMRATVAGTAAQTRNKTGGGGGHDAQGGVGTVATVTVAGAVAGTVAAVTVVTATVTATVGVWWAGVVVQLAARRASAVHSRHYHTIRGLQPTIKTSKSRRRSRLSRGI